MTRLWRSGLALALALAFAFIVVAPPERCPSVTTAELRRSSQAAVDWFVRNQAPEGTWLYLYNADKDETPDEYNPVRHAGVTMGLYQAAAARLPGALRSADRGTEWALDRLLERDDWAAFAADGRVGTGATALLVAGLVIRREATGDARYDDVLARLGRFLQIQTEPSGAVLATYDAGRGAPVPGAYSKYYTGEAYWALARMHLAFPSAGWGATANRIGAYLATSRDDVEEHWPPIPDHWAAYGQAETVSFPERGRPPLTEDEVDYARAQAQSFGMQTRWIAQRLGPWGRLVRGSYVPRGGGYGVTSEALTGWWLAAQADPRLAGLREPIAARATCVAGLAIEAQSDAADAAGSARPERVEGAWFIDGETRMDDQQHALAGLLRTIPIVAASPAAGAGDDAPALLLWIAVLVLALNPARAAFGIPRGDRSPRADQPAWPVDPRSAAGLAAAGGLIAGIVVCAVAAVADPLLDALDVSDPAFRIAAAIVVGLTGAGDVFRRPPPPGPILPGARAALVPVALPVLARPALVVAALAAGADRGVGATALAMAIAIAILTAIVAVGPAEGTRGRTLRWTARVLGAALVAGGVLLALDGVLDV